MALTNIETTIILDLYDYDTTPTKIKAIALDSKTRYVLASLRDNGNVYDAGQNTSVTLTIIRPNNTGVQIAGGTRQIVDLAPEGEVTVYGVYAELTQTALAVKGNLKAQFMLRSGDQILRTEIFIINCGEALDASTDTWAGEYHGYTLDELVENFNTAVGKVDAMEDDVSDLREGLSEYAVIEKISDMSGVEKNHVLVLHNDSAYGDGGPCWFEVMENVTENGYARKDGKKMCPMLDQAPLLTSDPPIEKMMGLMASYLENDALIYGNDNTLFDEKTTNDIDCSSFVSAILNGISYYGSKYTTGTNRRICKIASYAPVKTNIFGHLKTRRMAQYFAEHKWLHSMPTTYQMRNVLQFGDILFTGSGASEAENRYLKIDHVFFVLGTLNNDYVIVAQCGECPPLITKKNNTNTVGKISMIQLSSENIDTYFKAFARFPYINEHDLTFTGNRIKPILIPDTYIDGDRNGELSSSTVCATSYGYISVLPNSVITFTGKTVHNGNNLTAIVAEYDGKFQYLSKTNFTTNTKTLSASTRYIRLCYSHPSESDIPMLLDDCNQFEATLTT